RKPDVICDKPGSGVRCGTGPVLSGSNQWWGIFMSVSDRPREVDASLAQPADDGLFGPDSVTWRVLVSPAAPIGTATAVLAQMLHPRVARLLAQASTFERNPALRAELTAQYATTTTYGDTEAAERAGAALRRLHSRMKA